jgi:hypothetical protein
MGSSVAGRKEPYLSKRGESNSKETINEDIDVWTASRPTKPNLATAATKLKLNSKKTSTKSWHKKTNTDLAQEEDQTEIDEPNDDKEANENDTARKDMKSGEPDHNSPTADEGAITTTIGEFDKPSDEPLTITSEFKEPPTRSHIIDVGDSDTSEEEIDKPDNEPAQITSMPVEWFEVDDALSVPPRASEEGRETALTEEAAPIQPCERLHRSRCIVKVCGWATHGIFCHCPFVTKPTPSYALVTNLNVPRVLPINPGSPTRSSRRNVTRPTSQPLRRCTSSAFRWMALPTLHDKLRP